LYLVRDPCHGRMASGDGGARPVKSCRAGEATGLPCAIRDQSTVASLLGLQTCEEG
jgi:hypothetical protein